MSGDQGETVADTIVLTVDGPVARPAIPVLCERLAALLTAAGDERGSVICDVAGLAPVDMTALDALARLQLTARRRGRLLRLRHASAELRALLAMTGLGAVLPLEAGPSGQVRRQAEEREEPRGVEEERDAADSPLG